MNSIISNRTSTSPAGLATDDVDLSSYWDEANSVRVHLIDFGTDKAYGVAVLVDRTTDRDGLFVCVSKDLPAERRRGVVHCMLVSWARQFDAARAEGRTVVSAVAA